MKIIFLLFTFFMMSFSFKLPVTRNKNIFKMYSLKNFNEKPLEDMDIFEKFEKYSSENNLEKQHEYLYKIKKFLDRKYQRKNWQRKIKND